jgi:CPA1 family monovalent cation:H+ antiporter
LLFAIVAPATLASKQETAYPIVLVIGVPLLGFVPGAARPAEARAGVSDLPAPTDYAAAWNTSRADFVRDIAIIAFFAVGLVAFTVMGVALCAPLVFPAFNWRVGFVLGAVLAAGDAIAATAIAQSASDAPSGSWTSSKVRAW